MAYQNFTDLLNELTDEVNSNSTPNASAALYLTTVREELAGRHIEPNLIFRALLRSYNKLLLIVASDDLGVVHKLSSRLTQKAEQMAAVRR